MGSESENDVGAASPPKPKRSLFKKSSYAKPPEAEEAMQLFSRSKELFPDVVAENRRHLKKLERSRSNISIEPVERKEPEGKRRRISNELEDSNGLSSDDELTARLLRGRSTTTPQSPNGRLKSTPPKPRGSPSSHSKHSRISPRQKVTLEDVANQKAIVELSDSEEEITAAVTSSKIPNLDFDDSEDDIEILKPPAPIVPDVDIPQKEEEDEYAEFIAKAREGARRRVFERLDPRKSTASSEKLSSDPGTPNSETSNGVRPTKLPPRQADPVVQILITSRIEGTKPLILKRKLSQRLKDVRIGWCDKQVLDGQPISDSLKSQIFLTWRGNKVFDVTSCKAMGLNVDAQGRVRSEGEGVDTDGRIHLEAWTDEIFYKYKKQKEAERRRRALNPLEEEEEPEPEEPEAKEEPERVKIILKSKDYKEFKLMASSITKIKKLIAGFRSINKIPEEIVVTLHLDGDQLDPESTVSDADIEDMTTIDVHLN